MLISNSTFDYVRGIVDTIKISNVKIRGKEKELDLSVLENQKIVNVELNTEMKKSYIDYAMSVIVSRALPDVRDGLKPVHRRILYDMFESNLFYESDFRKSATTGPNPGSMVRRSAGKCAGRLPGGVSGKG